MQTNIQFTDRETISLADALALTLKDLNVKFVFGVGGSNIEHLHDAIYRLGDGKLSAILAKSEFSAAFMADGYARTHNTLGVCCSTSGGGMVNLAAGIAESYADNVPLLAIVGQAPTFLEGRGAFQDSSGRANTIDGLAFWQTITKYAAKITQPQQFWNYLEQALRTIFHKNPGPGVLLIPRDLFEAKIPVRPKHFSTTLGHYRHNSTCEGSLIAEFNNLLNTSRKPLMIVGKHAKYHQATENIRKFAHNFNCRVVTTLADVNAFEHADPHYLGMIGVCGHPEAHNFMKYEADLIIVVEDDCSVMTTADVNSSLNDNKLVYIGADATKACAAVMVDLVLEGNINVIFEKISFEHCNKLKIIKINNSIKPRRDIVTDNSIKNSGFSINQTIKSLERVLPKVDQVFFDAGNCVAAASHYLSFPANIKTVTALGMGGMGYAISAAIGAQLGDKDKLKTIVFTGDGGFLITGLEIQTAIEYNLSILFVVFNNNMHGMCATRQQLFFANRITASSYGEIQIAELVKGLGNKERLWSRCVNNISELEDSLCDYYEHNSFKTGVLEIKITLEEIPPFIPFLIARAKLDAELNDAQVLEGA
jgi:acetolactate synthase-1/2/3 large subunit